MMMIMNRSWTNLAALVGMAVGVMAAGSSITVGVDRPGPKVSPRLWGIFFEDINLSADGGLYAELVRNRSFEDSDQPEHWSRVGSGAAKIELSIDSTQPMSARNARSLKVAIGDPGVARAGVANGGYYGMSVVKGDTYDLTLRARSDGAFTGPLTVTLESADRVVYAKERLEGLTGAWQVFTCALKADATDPRARLVIAADRAGTFWMDGVSLFPRDTWKGHGFRKDLMQMLADLQPAFVRFPGGCWVEGNTLKDAYRWKETIGDPFERRSQHNLWGYTATHGIGFHEYLQLCEDLGAEPLFCINAGMSHRENVPMDRMGEFVQDALDALEYANGPADSTWGAVRARAGHPAPFNLKMLEIGNENGGPAYHERYALFHDAIKARYPDVRLVANDWQGIPRNRPLDIVDEHYYNNPEFFIAQAGKYDRYDRAGPRIFVGEYAVTQGTGEGSLRGAVGEAAFMTGLERNADVVAMASYAPLFVHASHRRWNPDLIVFDSSRAYGIPSYYVQKLFSEHRGGVILPCAVESAPAEPPAVTGLIGVGTWLTQAEFKDIRVTRGDEVLFSCDFAEGTKGWKLLGGQWKAEAGVLRQTAGGENIRAVAGDRKWRDYTYTLKARKLGGAEGFLILLGVDSEGRKSWWNLGGWGNQRHALEVPGIDSGEASVNGRIETGRWYAIRIELAGSRVRCYLDGKLIHDVQARPMDAVHASSTLSPDSREVILKVVNAAFTGRTVDVRLAGATGAGKTGRGWVLTSADAMDENSLDAPRRIAPVAFDFDAGAAFTRELPGNSVTILRVPLGR
jgi:alpha-L-arabinofuranosidase